MNGRHAATRRQTVIGLAVLLPLVFAYRADGAQVGVADSGDLVLQAPARAYVVVDSGQSNCYDDENEVACPAQGAAYHGQDAQIDGARPSYVDNGDGTVTDVNTGLMWQQTLGEKVTYAEAVQGAGSLTLAGYDDWRLPTIKELYSLIVFSGVDPSGWRGSDTSHLAPFIDTDYFNFEYGDESAGERIIDAQYWSSTEYVSTTMNRDATVFGVNFADGRIKGYPRDRGPAGSAMTEFVRYVRGNPDYGVNSFVDNGDGTVTDKATGLMWMQADSGTGYDWQGALDYAENLVVAGHDDWRLPNAKELQSIVDYTRSPATTASAAIDPVFASTAITDEGGDTNYPSYWSGTTHANMSRRPGSFGVYVAFGEALGYMEMPPGSGNTQLLDVHGAGAQRSDPKSGDPADWPEGNGPQGDVVRIFNYVRAVRDAEAVSPTPEPPSETPDTVLIPAGEFEMGDHHDLGGTEHPSDEIPIHTVWLDAFHIGTKETTNRQYVAYLNAALAQNLVEVREGLVYGVGGNDVYCDTRAAVPHSRIGWDGSAFSVLDGREDHPVTGVRWHGAAAYTNWLSAEHGLEPCYDAATWRCDFSKVGYRLPTEAEWEYAARGGRYGPYYVYPWGNDADRTKANWPNSGDPFETGSYAWTTPVGFYDGDLRRRADFDWPGAQEAFQTSDGANGYGLYDVAGNVWEWCNDWYGRDYYATSPSHNPRGPDNGTLMPNDRPYHVVRGGNWYNGENGHSRVANRNNGYYRGPDDPNHAWYHFGFRVARSTTGSQPEPTARPEPTSQPVPNRTVGLLLNDARAFDGYTLFPPKHYTTTYLIDNDGQVVHSWSGSRYEPGQSAYLLSNGDLLRAAMTRGPLGAGGGEGGRVEQYDWDGNLVWELDYSTAERMQHHDIEPMPNGNVLMLVVEKRTYDEVLAAGFDPGKLSPEVQQRGLMLPDMVVEIEPTRPSGGTVVWEWHVWDHLVQDHDASKANYGDPAAHPERIDADGAGRRIPVFWNHMNSIDYNAELDQIILSVRGNSEVWVIDHSTTTEEAAGPSGGRGGKGGDLLYRWGNPVAYGAGSQRDQKLLQQHDAQWIAEGSPGAGNILVFNNGLSRDYSSVDEFAPPVDASGRYALDAGEAFGPEDLTWTYTASPPTALYSEAISGAQRLPNGNTLIDDGVHGTFTEVTSAGEIVWRYVNPVIRTGPVEQGAEIPLDNRGHQYNAVFTVRRYASDFAGLAGRDLTPRGPLETYPQGTPTPTATPPAPVDPTATPTDAPPAWRIYLPLVMRDETLGRASR